MFQVVWPAAEDQAAARQRHGSSGGWPRSEWDQVPLPDPGSGGADGVNVQASQLSKQSIEPLTVAWRASTALGFLNYCSRVCWWFFVVVLMQLAESVWKWDCTCDSGGFFLLIWSNECTGGQSSDRIIFAKHSGLLCAFKNVPLVSKWWAVIHLKNSNTGSRIESNIL